MKLAICLAWAAIIAFTAFCLFKAASAYVDRCHEPNTPKQSWGSGIVTSNAFRFNTFITNDITEPPKAKITKLNSRAFTPDIWRVDYEGKCYLLFELGNGTAAVEHVTNHAGVFELPSSAVNAR